MSSWKIAGDGANLSRLLLVVALAGPVCAQNQTPANVPAPITWTDPNTGLMWTAKDSPPLVDQPAALAYCRNLNLAAFAGFKDWRLSDIDDLQSIYDPVVRSHVKGGIKIEHPFTWSSSPGAREGSFWGTYLQSASRRDYNGTGIAFDGGALCVRRAGAHADTPFPTPAARVSLPPAEPINVSSSAVWTDPNTGLMWTKTDNGSDVSWSQAFDYCNNLNLAGFKDWGLPKAEDVAGLYDPSVAQRLPPGYDVHIKGGIRLSSLFTWSDEASFDKTGKPVGAGLFNFQQGLRARPIDYGPSVIARVLCARRGER